MSYPDNNPKTAVGATKVPLHLVPPSAKHFLALALENGANKYGPYNWRDHAISVSVYKAAAERHLDAFWDGEDVAGDSGVHHIAHAMACMALILDAMTLGKLNDDRPTRGAASQLQFDYLDQRSTPP
jgi:dTDP-D-glucose 4,6-dehydratase